MEVIKTGNYNLISVLSTTIGLLCSGCWFTFGLYTNDLKVIIPNVLGIIFSIINLSCWIYYYRKASNNPSLQAFLKGNDQETALHN
jgi:hypothetical protein